MIKLQKRDATCLLEELASNAQNASCTAEMYLFLSTKENQVILLPCGYDYLILLFLSTKENQVIIPTRQQDIIYTRHHMTEILIECKGNCFSYRKLNSFAIQYL